MFMKSRPILNPYEQSHPPKHCATFKHVTSSMFQLKGKPVFQVSNSLGSAPHLSVKIMGVCLDQDLLLAQIFALGTKDKQNVRSGTSRVEP